MKKSGMKTKRRMQKAVGKAPKWLATAVIGDRVGTKKKPLRGSFGAASEVVRIDPKTGLPREAS